MVQENNEQRNATERRSEAALWPDGEALSILDAALDVFMTLPGHTSTREDDEQLVGSAAMRYPRQQTHFTLSHLRGISLVRVFQ